MGPVDPHTAMWMRDAARRDEGLPTHRPARDNSEYFPYRYGQALWAYIAGALGRRGGRPHAARHRGRDTNDAGDRAQGRPRRRTRRTLSKEWHAPSARPTRPPPSGKKDADAYGPALVTEKDAGGELNVAPALSPDGTQPRLPLRARALLDRPVPRRRRAPARSRSKLSRPSTDPHFESLQFISSAGAWDRSRQALRVRRPWSRARPPSRSSTRRGGKRARDPVPDARTRSTTRPGRRTARRSRSRRSSAGSPTSSSTTSRRKALRPPHRTTPTPTCSRRGRPTDGRSPSSPIASRPISTRSTPATTGSALLDVDVRARSRRCPASTKRQEHQPAVGGGRHEPLLPLRPQRHHQHLSPGRGQRRAAPAHRPPHRRQRHHRAEPRPLRRPRHGRLAYSVYEQDRYEIYAIEDAARLAGGRVPHRCAAQTASLIPGGKRGGRGGRGAASDPTSGLPAAGSVHEDARTRRSSALDYVGQPYARRRRRPLRRLRRRRRLVPVQRHARQPHLGTVLQVERPAASRTSAARWAT